MKILLLLMASSAFLSPAVAEPIASKEIVGTDGDTIKARNSRFRLTGFDTPEIGRSKCASEKALGRRAKRELQAIIDSGIKLDLTEVRCSCPESKIGTRWCNNGRKCGTLSVNGKNVGEAMIAQGLASRFVCSRTKCPKQESWCCQTTLRTRRKRACPIGC